jgi:hypothetical protein
VSRLEEGLRPSQREQMRTAAAKAALADVRRALQDADLACSMNMPINARKHIARARVLLLEAEARA